MLPLTEYKIDKIIFLFVWNTDKRLQFIADEVGVSMTTVSRILDEFLRGKIKSQINIKQQKKQEFIILQSKMNYD